MKAGDSWALVGVEVYAVRGSHGDMGQEPHVPILAASLRECLERAQWGGGRLAGAVESSRWMADPPKAGWENCDSRPVYGFNMR